MTEREESKGPWRRKSNGNVVVRREDFPGGGWLFIEVDEAVLGPPKNPTKDLPDDCELLVPQSRAPFWKDTAEGYQSAIDQYVANLAEANKRAEVFEHNWLMQASHLPLIESMADLTPAAMRFTARTLQLLRSDMIDPDAWVKLLQAKADRLESEQTAKAEHEATVGAIAEAIANLPADGMSPNGPWPDAFGIAQSLVANPRFTITRAEVE